MSDAIFKSKKANRRLDKIIIGMIAGILFPLVGLLFLMFFWGDGNANAYFSYFTNFGNPRAMETSSKLISLSMLANLIPFYYFLNRKFYNGTKGIIIMMFLWAILIFLYKFAWQ